MIYWHATSDIRNLTKRYETLDMKLEQSEFSLFFVEGNRDV